MEYFEKKITYLRGLCDGSGFDETSNEGKIFHGILEVLDDMAFMLETFMDDEEMEPIGDMDMSEFEMAEDEEEPMFYFSFICPNCGDEFEVDEQTMDTEENLICPKCGNVISMDTVDADQLSL